MSDGIGTSADGESSFWRYCNDKYRDEQVREICLQLQDSFGAEVVLLLFACWTAECRKIALSPADVKTAIAAVTPWQRDITCLLRQVRRRLKSFALPDQAASIAELRAEVFDCELFAERIACESLAATAIAATAIAESRPTGASARVMRENLKTYIAVADLDPQSAPLADDLAAAVCAALTNRQ